MPYHKKNNYNRVTNLHTADIEGRVSKLQNEIADIKCQQEALVSLKIKLIDLLSKLKNTAACGKSSDTDAGVEAQAGSSSLSAMLQEYSKVLDADVTQPRQGDSTLLVQPEILISRPQRRKSPVKRLKPATSKQGSASVSVGGKRGRKKQGLPVKGRAKPTKPEPSALTLSDESSSSDNDSHNEEEDEHYDENKELEYLNVHFDFLSATEGSEAEDQEVHDILIT